MYTQCPHCGTYFAVGAAQLRAGHGEVRCGQCLNPFDAIPYLRDVVPEEEAGSEPAAGETGAGEGAPAAEMADAPSVEPEEAMSGGAPPSDPDPATTEKESAEPGRPGGDGETDEAAGVPEVLREDMARFARLRIARKQRIALGVGVFVLCLVFAGQYSWVNSRELLQRYPGFRPWLTSFCMHTGCVVPENRHPSRIQIAARDVRVHPKYEGALLITATMVNTLSTEQPFPRMQFTLFNVNGRILASRVFGPREYLESDFVLVSGMKPRKPVQVSLGVMALEEPAVSFEFRFL